MTRRGNLMKIKFSAVFLILLFFISPCARAAGDASNIYVRQAYADTPEVNVYFDVTDSSENPVNDIKLEQLNATLGEKSVDIKSVQPFKDAEEGVAYIFLVDISTSVSYYFKQMCDSMKSFIDTAGSKDKIAIITYGQGVKVVQDYTSDREILKSKIGIIKPTDSQTHLHNGLVKAIEMGRRRDIGLPERRVIITLSDGKDDCTGGYTRQEVLDKMREDSVPVYAIGFYNSPLNDTKRGYLSTLGEFARTSGGEYFQIGPAKVMDIYSDIHKRAAGGFKAVVFCENTRADGTVYRLQVNLTDGNRALNDGLNIRILPKIDKAASTAPPEEEVEEVGNIQGESSRVSILYFILGIPLIALLVLLVLKRIIKMRKKTDKEFSGANSSKKQGIQKPGIKDNLDEGIKIRLTLTGKGEYIPDYVTYLKDSIVLGISSIAENLGVFDPEISERHCEITAEDNIVFIRDLESDTGTYVNGARIEGKYRIHNSDLIRIGKTEIFIVFNM